MYLKTIIAFIIIKIVVAYHTSRDNSLISMEPSIVDVDSPYSYDLQNSDEINSSSAKDTQTNCLPADLIELAALKLGIKDLNAIPSLSELAEVLGTASSEETIEIIRDLASTESGMNLIKSFIESSDRAGVVISNPTVSTCFSSETTQTDLGFFQRLLSYINIFD